MALTARLHAKIALLEDTNNQIELAGSNWQSYNRTVEKDLLQLRQDIIDIESELRTKKKES